MAHLSIATYNLHGLNQGLPLLHELVKQFDVICIQEHWLSSDQFYKLESLSPDFTSFNKSAMDKVCADDILRGRPFGGTSILVHSRLANCAKYLASEANFIIVKVCDIILVNMYLPCRSNTQDYQNVLCDIFTSVGTTLDAYPDIAVVLAGDFNCCLNRNDRATSTHLTDKSRESMRLLISRLNLCDIWSPNNVNKEG